MIDVSMTTSSNRLQTKLVEQLGFLSRSAQLYDQGIEDEAIRLAVPLRILFYDKPTSHSLLQQLGLDSTKMLSSLKDGQGGWMACLAHKIDPSSPHPISMVPRLNASSLQKVSFNKWWGDEEIFNHDGVGYTRSKIILSVAHRDGGAHVDRLEQYYKVLCTGEWAIGITGSLTYAGKAPFQQGLTIYPDNAHLALLRQFASEVVSSADRYMWREAKPISRNGARV